MPNDKVLWMSACPISRIVASYLASISVTEAVSPGPVSYTHLVDNKYAPQAEASIVYNDETLGIDWMLGESQMLLSPKDKEGMAFRDAVYFE